MNSENIPHRYRRSRRWWLRRSIAAGSAVWPGMLAVRAGSGRTATPSRRDLASEIEQTLWQQILPAWYPRSLDTEHGGYWEAFAEDWSRRPASTKFLVYQARMTWTPAAVALDYPQRSERYLDYTRHGLKFLRDRMWDRQHGGSFDTVAEDGSPLADRRHKATPWKAAYHVTRALLLGAQRLTENTS
jgi:mannose/cellobiose epimerase-like protein (N-acyl-D-glucosamine 2-epimerase family)